MHITQIQAPYHREFHATCKGCAQPHAINFTEALACNPYAGPFGRRLACNPIQTNFQRGLSVHSPWELTTTTILSPFSDGFVYNSHEGPFSEEFTHTQWGCALINLSPFSEESAHNP